MGPAHFLRFFEDIEVGSEAVACCGFDAKVPRARLTTVTSTQVASGLQGRCAGWRSGGWISEPRMHGFHGLPVGRFGSSTNQCRPSVTGPLKVLLCRMGKSGQRSRGGATGVG